MHKGGSCADVPTGWAYGIPANNPQANMLFFYVWTPCEQSTVHVLHRDMNSRFILLAHAVSDFPHFTGHPAVRLHCTCSLQFVSRRFPKSQNILSAVQRAPHMQKRWSKNWVVLGACGQAHCCHCAGVVLKINGCMLTRFDMLYKGRHLWSQDTAK